MTTEARSPEELDTLLEDAFVLRDVGAVGRLFAPRAIVVPGVGVPPVRGRDRITEVLAGAWERGLAYVPDPIRVLQAGDTALGVSDAATAVMHRDGDRAWRFAIAVLSLTGNEV